MIYYMKLDTYYGYYRTWRYGGIYTAEVDSETKMVLISMHLYCDSERPSIWVHRIVSVVDIENIYGYKLRYIFPQESIVGYLESL